MNWRVYAFGQYAGTPLLDGSNSFPWIAGFNGGLSRRYFIDPCFSHRPSISFFGRYLSESQDGFSETELDRDIFTLYKRNHRYGLRLSDQFTFQRYMDRRFYIRPMLNSNEDQLIPDNVGFSVGADQLFGALQVRLAYRMLGFLADNDRAESALIHEIDGGTSIGIYFSRFFNDARLYRDFRPGTVLFRPLRQERAAKINSR